MRLRIAVGRRLLQETDSTIDIIAEHVGYSGAETFSRAFKEITGVRPGEFRRRRLD